MAGRGTTEQLLKELVYQPELISVSVIELLLSGLEKPDVGRAMERHKRLLLRNTRDLLRAIRDEGTPLQRVGRE